LKWLNAFAIINEIAANKILKKFMKEHFQLKDNTLDKNVLELLKNMEFCSRRNISPLMQDYKVVYSKFFTDSNLKKAKNALDGETSIVTKNDLLVISLFSGGIVVLILYMIFYLIHETHNESTTEILLKGI